MGLGDATTVPIVNVGDVAAEHGKQIRLLTYSVCGEHELQGQYVTVPAIRHSWQYELLPTSIGEPMGVAVWLATTGCVWSLSDILRYIWGMLMEYMLMQL